MRTHEELHAEAMQNYAMAHHYLGKLKETLDQMTAGRVGSGPITSPIRCVREWTDWLSLNGPTLKPDIVEATGVKFNERGTAYTVEWSPSLSQAPDDQFAPNTIMKISSRRVGQGRGAPPKVYFLWSQRWDVHPLFGVGPVKSESEVPALNLLLIPGPDEYGVMPPGDAERFDAEIAEALSQPTRFATMGEWDAYYAPTFDALVSAETKPSDEQKQTMRDTLPEGTDANAALAIAYRNAVLRSRQTSAMTGVVQPPDLSGVEVVGSHNHVPHIYGPLCQVSDCRPA